MYPLLRVTPRLLWLIVYRLHIGRNTELGGARMTTIKKGIVIWPNLKAG